MKLKEVETLLTTMIEKRTRVTPMLWASHGIGKSSIVNQVGKKLGYKVVTMILSQKEAVDVAGVLYTFEDKELGLSVTSAHPPVWFAEAVKRGKTIIFCDEFNQARREVMNAAFELVLDRRLNNITLPNDVFIVCAGNPDDDRYDVTPMSQALIDRLMHIQVTSDTSGWLAWAENNIHPDVVSFIRMSPESACIVDKRDAKFPVDIKHSYRSLERLSEMHKLDLPSAIKYECFKGIVGTDIATSFIRTLAATDKPISAADILAMSDSTVAEIKRYADPVKMRVDLLAATVNNVLALLTDSPAKGLESADNLKRFINMLPDDVAMKLVTGVYRIKGYAPVLMSDPVIKAKIGKISEATSLTPKKKGS